MNPETQSKLAPCFKQASDLWHDGEPQAALEIFHRLAAEHPQQPAITGMIGSIYFSEKDYEQARVYFHETVCMSPKSELASRGLFHSLWQIGERDAAFAEMKRFVSISESAEYDRLICEMNEYLAEHGSAKHERPRS